MSRTEDGAVQGRTKRARMPGAAIETVDTTVASDGHAPLEISEGAIVTLGEEVDNGLTVSRKVTIASPQSVPCTEPAPFLVKFPESTPRSFSVPVEPQKKTYKVAIVGKAPSSLGLAPYMDREWSIWGLSDLWRHMARPVTQKDVWFELHNIDTGRKRWPPEYFQWLMQNQEKVPLYIGHKLRVDKYSIAEMTLDEAKQLDAETKPNKYLPHARQFPVYEVLKRFGTYFNNSISFMMALAAMQGATHVGVYGVDMAQSDPVMGQNGEYEHQRPSCEYMLGVLKGMGIEVFVPGEADLLKCKKLYAFETHGCEDEEDKKRLARQQELQNSIKQGEAQLQQIQSAIIARKGALDQLHYDYRRSR